MEPKQTHQIIYLNFSYQSMLGNLFTVFIIKTCPDQILAKLIYQGVAAALFSSRHPKNLQNEKISLCLEIAEIDLGVNFGSRRTIVDIKNSFF